MTNIRCGKCGTNCIPICHAEIDALRAVRDAAEAVADNVVRYNDDDKCGGCGVRWTAREADRHHSTCEWLTLDAALRAAKEVTG